MSKKDNLSKLIHAIQKDLGGAAKISQMSEVIAPFATRLPTGILSLDLALNGGFPGGSMHQLFGPDGAGKDYLSNLIMAQVQKTYEEKANIAWMSFGYKPDIPFMEMCGIDMDVGNLMFIDVGNEEALDQPAESLLTAMLDLIRANKFQLMIINELGSGETKDNVKKKLHEDARIATWASLMATFCQKFYSAMRKIEDDGTPNKTCVIMINPVRANIDARTAKYFPYSQGGGYALKHAKAVDLHLRVGSTIKSGGEKIGKEIKWKISKGKHGVSEGAEGGYSFIFNQGVDLIEDLANTAKSLGVIKSSGPVYYILDYTDKVKGGIAGVVTMLKESPKLCEEVRQAVLGKTTGNG
jgi:RecA/RadA recombinase